MDEWTQDEIDDDQFQDDEELDEFEEASANCGMMPDGLCGLAGSEYCDFECPFRDAECLGAMEARQSGLLQEAI